MDGIRRRKTAGVLAVLVALLVGMTGCGSDSPDSGGRTGASPAANPTDIAREASEFAGIVIPANATVLDAETEGRLDTLYRLAVLRIPLVVPRQTVWYRSSPVIHRS